MQPAGQPLADTLGTELAAKDVLRIEQALDAARSKNTRRQYKSAWATFASWANLNGHKALPAEAQVIAAYLTEMESNRKSASTIEGARAAIGAAHRDAGLVDPTQHEGVRRVLRGVKRQARGRGRGQAQGLTAEDIAAMLATADIPRQTGRGIESTDQASARGAIDKAICGLLFHGGLRRSEAAALTWGDVLINDTGVLVTVRTSKTNQKGDRHDVRFLKNGCAAAMRSLRNRRECDLQGQPEAGDLVLGGLNGASIARRLAAAARAAGIDGRITGHSGRVGLATELTQRGASTTETMLAGGWTTARMVAHYSAGAVAERGAVAKYL